MRAVFALLLAIFTPWAVAGYAMVNPPPAFQSVGGVSTMNVGTAANGARYAGGHVMANATVNLGARTVTVPVAMRVAANAATFTVTRLNPWVSGAMLAVSAIGLIRDWFGRSGENLDVSSEGQIIVPGTIGPVTTADLMILQSDGTYKSVAQAMPSMYCASGNITTNKMQDACSAGGSVGRWMISGCAGGWSNGWSGQYCGSGAIPQGQPSSSRPATEDDLAPLVNFPVNPALLEALGLTLPVDPVPIINPASEPVGDVLIGPAGNPAPQLAPKPEPLRFPDGDPVPIPNTNPQRYTQPWLEVHPSPTPTQPWRVDIRPIVTETTNPDPQPDPTPDPDPPSEPPPFDFYTDCDKFPGSIGCMPTGDVPGPETVPAETRSLELQSGPVFAGSGCPASTTLTVAGRTFTAIETSAVCGWVSGVMRPVILLLAFFSAVMIVRAGLKT